MIKQIKSLPAFSVNCAERLKIKSAFSFYKDIALLFVQDEKTFISLLDGNMVIDYGGTDIAELFAFINTVSPKTVFAKSGVLENYSFKEEEKCSVLVRKTPAKSTLSGDTLKSDEIYSILNTKGLSLPPYEYFAVDFCRKLNGGGLYYFALKDVAAAIVLKEGETLLLNGIASRKKGMGSVALNGVLAKCDYKTVFCVSRQENLPFYYKNGFEFSYNVSYWRL